MELQQKVGVIPGADLESRKMVLVKVMIFTAEDAEENKNLGKTALLVKAA